MRGKICIVLASVAAMVAVMMVAFSDAQPIVRSFVRPLPAQSVEIRRVSVSVDELAPSRGESTESSQDLLRHDAERERGWGLEVWTNNPDGHYVDGERLIVSLKAENDGFVKLDYFQADGCVIHLIPNVYRGQARIKGKQVYSFGGDRDPEHFVVRGPFGPEYLKAIVMQKPITDTSLDSSEEGCHKGQEYLRQLDGMRGLLMTVGSVEISLPLFTSPREKVQSSPGKNLKPVPESK